MTKRTGIQRIFWCSSAFALSLIAGCESTQAPPSAASAPRPASGTVTHELVIYRPSAAAFFVQRDDAGKSARTLPFGAPGDIPLWADFNGDGKSVPGLYRKGQWLISSHADSTADVQVNFGGDPADVPLAGDVDGDGKADLVIFRSGTWIVRGTRNPNAPFELHFGASGDVPLLADFDGDGKIDLAVYRAGAWYVDTHRDGKGDLTFAFGGAQNDRPLAAGWNGDGHAVPILFRDGQWLVSGARDGKTSATASFGGAGDVPLAVTMPK